jgi:hypothetical protein
VIAIEILESRIKRAERTRLSDFNERDLEHLRALFAEFGGERSGLMAGSAYEYAHTL